MSCKYCMALLQATYGFFRIHLMIPTLYCVYITVQFHAEIPHFIHYVAIPNNVEFSTYPIRNSRAIFKIPVYLDVRFLPQIVAIYQDSHSGLSPNVG
jgi:hypothetical protein